MADIDWLTIVKAKEDEESELHVRQDGDTDLRNLKQVKIKTLDGSKDMPDVANVWLPEPALFMSKTIAKLVGVQRQPEIKANKKTMSDQATTRIEEWIEDEEYEVDALLRKTGRPPAFNYNADIACSRGRVGERILTWMKDGKYIPGVRPMDMRYFSSEMDEDGMAWGSYMTTRSKVDIEKQYGISISGKKALVRDIWSKEDDAIWNTVYVDKHLIRRQTSKEVLGYALENVPFTFEIVATGSVLEDENSLKYKGESVFETLRKVFPELNFLATTLKTLNYQLFEPPLQMPTERGLSQTPPKKSPAKSGRVTMTEKGAPITTVFTPDIRRYTTLFNEIMTAIKESAGYSSIDFGSVSWPMSDVALARLAQGKLELLLPRLQALAHLYQARYVMMAEQFIAIGEKIELGESWRKRTYEPSMLEGAYTIEFRYFHTSITEMASSASIANSMGDLVSEDYKRREILKLPDPDGEKMKIRAEQAEAEDEAVRLNTQGLSLIEVGREVEAEFILLKLEGIIRQRRMPALAVDDTAPELQKGKSPASLFAARGSGGRPPKAEAG